MHIEEYQEKASETAIYPGRGLIEGLVYAVLGLNGEAGELAEKLKKLLRDEEGWRGISLEQKAQLSDELGDVLWYLSQVAFELEVSLDVIAQSNLDKLQSRKDRDKLRGSGDNR